MVFQVSSNCRIFMLANALVQVSDCVPDKQFSDWLKKLKEEVKVTQQADMNITLQKVSQFLRRVPNWKAPGPDLVQGFWLKNFTSLHPRIANQLQSCLDNRNMPEWMAKGRAVLIMEDPEKGATYSRELSPHNVSSCHVEAP